MAILGIREFGDPVLRRKADPVDGIDDAARKLISDLTETMVAAHGAGLAAPQVGISRRIFVWRNGEESGALANPEILESEGSVEAEEACLSLPGLAFPVSRAQRVVVAGLDGAGKAIKVEASDFTARIIQHEIDHLDGVLFIDRLAPELQKEAKRQLRDQALGLAQPTETTAI